MSDVESRGTAKLEFQVIVRILEARNLVGLDIDPCIEVSIRDQKKITKTKKSTNSAVFDEDFTFQFSIPLVVFQQQIITIEAISDSRLSLLRRSSIIGCFKIDVATVKSQPDSCFVHKWALLLDSNDPLSGPKGYVKCDLIICTPGIIPKTPEGTNKDDEDIEGNLLIPEDFSKNIERQPARYFVTIFEAKDLPPKTSGVMASMKKAFVGDAPKELIDPFVQVSFAGKTGKTSVKRNCANPKWFEEIVFYEMFPSLVKIIRIHIKDENQSIIATTFLDFTLIADNSMNGFLPTFGPAWLNLYGNHRDNSDESSLNLGIGEGLAYRGSLKLSLSVQILDAFPKKGLHTVENRNVQQNQTNVEMIPMERFLLFCTIFDTDMIDKKYSGKQAHFEITFGKEGLNEDLAYKGKEDSTKKIKQDRQSSEIQTPKGLSTTPSSAVVSLDKLYCLITSCVRKPCMHLFMDVDDFRKRLFMINRLKNFSSDILNVMKQARQDSMKNLEFATSRHSFVKRFIDNCKCIINLLESEYTPVDIATFLDLEKQRQRKRELDGILKCLTDMKKQLDTASPEYLLNSLEKCLSKLKLLATEPQDSLPDAYLWLICESKKIAFKRFKPEDLLYSADDNECGKLCSKVESFFLKTPVVKDTDDQSLRYQVKAYFWLGTENERVYCINKLPPTFNVELGEEDPFIPHAVEYIESNEFELRCHVFQGRSLIGSDDSGLSDPFVRVFFNGHCQQSQIIEQTLCPFWDECLVFPNITLYGKLQYIKDHAPCVTAQVYDFDKLGENEFLGQGEIGCKVKLATDSYSKPNFPPALECCNLLKNKVEVGEILAVCELIQVENNVEPYPNLPNPDVNRSGSFRRIPADIKPVLSDYRLEVLFWGLRELKTSSMLPVDQPKIQIDWGNGILESESIVSYKKNPNFKTLVKSIQMKLPDDFTYQPPITIRCVDSRAFGRNVLIGTCTVNNIRQYMISSVDEQSDGGSGGTNSVFSLIKSTKDQMKSLKASQKLASSMPNLMKGAISEDHLVSKDFTESLTFDKQSDGNLTASYSKCENLSQLEHLSTSRHNLEIAVPIVTVTDSTVTDKKVTPKVVLDWWSKYYASIEALEEKNRKETNEAVNKQINSEKSLNESSSSLYEKALNVSSKKMKNIGKQIMSKTDMIKIPDTETLKEQIKHVISKHDLKKLNIATLQIYDRELETVPEFNGFKDCFEVFNLYRGKKLSDEVDDSSRIAGKFKVVTFKGLLSFQRITNANQPIMISRHLNNEPVKVMVRIYVIKASNLRPCDPSGKADPYLNIILGKTKICDKANKIFCQLNPIFGKLFEIEANFPEESELVIQIYDWDRLSSDDLMGETKIDLEQRYYSKHRASCGLPLKFESTGYNAWRDSMKPTQILTKLCKLYGLSEPVYSKFSVTVDDKVFISPKTISTDKCPQIIDNENLALSCLHQWKDLPHVGYNFVPEHVETRTLFLPDKPGMEQGKLELWIDMFPMTGHVLPPPTNITVRKAKSYELRVMIWDTKDVTLDDYNALTGTSSVDQYIKCFLIGPDVDGQQTDIHYRSLNGEGNFNWRFIFKFDYMDAEEKIVHRTKESHFSLVEHEEKLPPKLNLHVWDADVISADDFLGNLALNLAKVPRGAKSAKTCSMDLLKPSRHMKSKSYLNLFHIKRTRGWYPFVRQEKKGEAQLTGKVDLELQLMSAEDADKKPAGYGRDAPEPMPPPQRPETSFAWFSSPFKMLKYDVWIGMRWRCCQLLCILLIILFLCMFVYTLPEAFAQKLIQTSL